MSTTNSSNLNNHPANLANNLPTKIIYCPRSGLPLCSIQTLCSQGWPLLNTLSSQATGLIHPIYGMPLEKLITKLSSELQGAEAIAWCAADRDQVEIRLTMSAIMYSLDAIWQPPAMASHLWSKLEPSLPSWAVAIGCGARLVKLASWYHFATSKRLSFPSYRTASGNANTEWQNFSVWLDDAWAIKTEWESGRDRMAEVEELRKREAALATVRSEAVYKRIDFNKVWGWIDIQMKQDSHYPAGRRETFKAIFFHADTHPEDWTVDDIDDLQLAIVETCDMGNDISFFINNRLRVIRNIITDFYSSFTLLSRVSGDINDLDSISDEERKATDSFFAGFDHRAKALDTLPPEPKRDSFESMAKYLQACAQWRILKRRYDLVAKPAAEAPKAS